jgi:hypothetical protein
MFGILFCPCGPTAFEKHVFSTAGKGEKRMEKEGKGGGEERRGRGGGGRDGIGSEVAGVRKGGRERRERGGHRFSNDQTEREGERK